MAGIEAPSWQLAAMASDGPRKRSVEVTHRNLPALHFRAYALDLEKRLASARDYNLLPAYRELNDLVASGTPAAAWTVDRLKEAGLSAALRETGDVKSGIGSGHPVVLGSSPGAPDYKGPHVLFYGHYDVQPADPLALWESGPFEPVIKDAVPGGPGRRIVARGGPELADVLDVEGYAAFVPAEDLAEPPVPARPGSLDELFAL